MRKRTKPMVKAEAVRKLVSALKRYVRRKAPEWANGPLEGSPEEQEELRKFWFRVGAGDPQSLYNAMEMYFEDPWSPEWSSDVPELYPVAFDQNMILTDEFHRLVVRETKRVLTIS